MPMLTDLAAQIEGRVIEDADVLVAYETDQCMIAESEKPLAVVLASSVEDVQATLRFATEHGVAVVPRGAGTGLAGAANALKDCIVLSLERMGRILEIDPVARTARVEPGVLNADLDRAAREHGLFYAPDPGSRAISTIGGNLATNAGGMCCAKYGVTADHVLRLTAVLIDGEVVETGRAVRKDVAGLNLTRLLVGSEGSLAVIVEATVRLLPVPETAAIVAAVFPSVDAAITAVLDVGCHVTPAAVELMDATTVRAINEMTGMGLDESAGATVLIEYDGPAAYGDAVQGVRLAEAAGATECHVSSDPGEREALMNARRAALPALEHMGSTLLDDVSVPVHLLPAMLAAIREISLRHEIVIGTFGHAADGNLHPTIVFDGAEPTSRMTATRAFEEIVETALDLGGSISGEHGVGALKIPFMSRQHGERERELMRGIKSVFDPDNLLNPGRAI
ncbi:FAD-binding oxidoreductase [Dietzia maris]|uniref:FAD-binding oxidoreductase n=1 Tax=Dietzia maris TaxID=37915 RepID=UPI0037CB7B63